jgi:bacterioferritin (cytochrome b1)
MAAPENPSVVEALNAVYRAALLAFEQFHRQEHRFEVRYRYKKLADRFDKLVHCARSWRRAVLNRIERLGGEADSTLGPVKVNDGVREAYEDALDALDAIRSAVIQGIAVASSANDYPTHKVLLFLSKEVDHKHAKIEAHLRQLKDMGDVYLATAV